MLSSAVEAAQAQLHPWTIEHTTSESRRAALTRELSWPVDGATHDMEFASRFQRDIPRPGATAEDYLNRWVQVSDDLEVLIGPRFRGLDPERPFISVEVASRLVRQEDLGPLADVCRSAIPAFAPRSLVFWSREQPTFWPTATADMRFVAGPIGLVRAQRLPAGVEARVSDDVDFYGVYRDAFNDSHSRQPERAEWTRLEDRSTLIDLQKQGLIVELLAAGRWTGFAAVESADMHGLTGLSVVELFLLPEFRGQGLGSSLSVGLAHAVDRPDDHVLMGTIHWNNHAARRAAARSGRVDLGGEVVVPISR